MPSETQGKRPAGRRHHGVLLMALGAVLMVLGAAMLLTTPDVLQYAMSVPTGAQADALEALAREAQEQMDSLADSLGAYAVAARAQGQTLYAGKGRGVTATVYAVGEGYFDAVHETLERGRLISAGDIQRAEHAIVLDSRVALTLLSGEEPVGQRVTLNGIRYEVAGVIRGGRRVGETDEFIAYVPVTAASADALPAQSLVCVARPLSAVGSAILMEDTLSAWRGGGSFYSLGKLKLGAVMPLRWALLFAGAAVLLALLRRMNAFAWGRVCRVDEALKTRYARDMLLPIAGSAAMCLLGYGMLAAALWALASFSIQPLLVFTEWIPEVIVELSSLESRFWALAGAGAPAVRIVTREVCRLELGRGLLRWGLMAALLGLALHGIPWLNRAIAMPALRKER